MAKAYGTVRFVSAGALPRGPLRPLTCAPMRRHLLPTGLLCLVLLGASACGSSGRDLRPPAENAVSPKRSTSSTASIAASPALTPLTLTSPAFTSGQALPAELTCTGPSPALTWTGVPAATAELVLIVTDTSEDGYVHWLVTGIAPANASIAVGEVPPGGTELVNSSGRTGWLAPCPPAGVAHTYDFILLALPQPSAVAPGTEAKAAVTQLMPLAGGGTSILKATLQLGGPAGTGPTGTGARGTAAVGTAPAGTSR